MPVKLSKSAQESVKDLDRIRTLPKGQARKTAETIVRRKRQNARALRAARQDSGDQRGRQN